jgi:hypothetical protein
MPMQLNTASASGQKLNAGALSQFHKICLKCLLRMVQTVEGCCYGSDKYFDSICSLAEFAVK